MGQIMYHTFLLTHTAELKRELDGEREFSILMKFESLLQIER